MKQPPVISVIVPVYNSSTYLEQCLDSIAAQTYRNMEIILVDDGSSDSSADICRHYASTDNRFLFISHAANQGQSAARNTGLAEATGDYIAFVDSDDIISPTLMESLHQLLTANHAQLAAVPLTRFTDTPAQFTSQKAVQATTIPARTALVRMLAQTGVNSSVCGKLFTRESIQRLRFPNGQLYEVLDFMSLYLTSTSHVTCSEAKLYHYRRNPQSTLGTFRMKRLDVLDVTQNIMSRSINDRHILKAAMDRHLSASFNMYVLLCRNKMAGSSVAQLCWSNIRSIRIKSLFNPRVRLKNKLGILASLTGPKIFSLIARHSSL